LPYCRYCGKELIEGARFCPNCGAPVVTATAPQAMGRKEPRRRPVRPVGISLLAVLEAIASFFMLFGGIALIGVAAFLAAGGWGTIAEEELQRAIRQLPWASGFTGMRMMALTTAFLAVMGIIILLLAVIGFIMAWGLWAGKRWAWTITMILSAIGIVLGLFSLPGSIVSIIIYLAIIYYLTRPYVKAYYYR